MRITVSRFVNRMESAGYHVQNFSVRSQGRYTPEDADWNYKDVPHLNVVHSNVDTIPTAMDDDLITTLNLQKVLGFRMPMTVVNFAHGPREQAYYSTLGPFVLLVHTQFEGTEEQTTVNTTYHVAAPGLARFAFPLIKRVLSKNYEVLMSEDLPMRDRRGELRRRGYAFRSDGRTRTFAETTDLRFSNVVPPEGDVAEEFRLPVSKLGEEGARVDLGDDGHQGIRLERQGDQILALPRLCPHEGASLDCAELVKGKVSCPWHARLFNPVGRLNLTTDSEQDGAVRLRIEDEDLVVTRAATPGLLGA